MNTRAKGSLARRQVMEWYVTSGYDVSIVERTGKFIKEKDAFGLFDLCAWKADVVEFVQVTCNRPHTHTHFEVFSQTHSNAHIVQLVKYNGNVWSCWRYEHGQRKILFTKQKLQ